MGLNKKDVCLQIGLFLISVVCGFLCYRFISLKVIDQFYNLDHIFKAYFLLFSHSIIFYFFFKLIFKIKITQIEKMVLVVTYGIFMFLTFFDRVWIGERIINVTRFDLVNTIQETGFVMIVFNVMIFCPFYTAVGLIKETLTSNKLFIIFCIVAIGVELLQFITMSGIFDVVDLLLYVLGYFIGKGLYDIGLKKI